MLNEILLRACYIFYGHVLIHPVLVEQVDAVGPETFQHCVGNDLDVIGAAIRPRRRSPVSRVDVPPELGCDYDLVANRGQSFPHQLLVFERTVYLRCVEEGEAQIDGRTNQTDRLIFLYCLSVAVAQSHAAEPKGRYLDAAFS